jgi:phytoene desaturase
MRQKTAAIIGSGFGGLAAAIRLQAAGFATVVYEQLDKPGGRAYVFEDAGYTFDAGPTVVTAPDDIAELFALAGRSLRDYVELVPVRPMYRLFWEDGETFDYDHAEERLLAEIRRISPRDVDGYRRFYDYALEVFEEGYVKLCHVPFLRFWDMARVAPQLLRVKAQVPVYQTVSRFFEHEKLRQAFSFNSLLIGGNPFKASSIYTLIHPLERRWGVSFPRGGTGALVRALARLFTDIGGELRLATGVERIETSGGRVRGVREAGGRRQAFDVVVSNADVTTTYDRLLAGEPLARAPASKLKRMRHSMSLFVTYFGTRKSYPKLVHHNVMFGARYRELLDDIFERGVLADDFSLYVHAPTLTDPSLAPPGGHAFYALSPVPHLGKAKIDWEKTGPAYARRIVEYLDRRYMPGLAGDIVTQQCFTPQDFESRLGAHQGSAFSLEPTLTQSAWFRVHNRDPRIGGLYFVGAGTHPGAGIPGVIGSAKATAATVLADLGLPGTPSSAPLRAAWEGALG